MATVDKEYLAKLLVHGISQVQAAAAVGCSQGYISQLIESDAALQAAITAEDAKLAKVKLKKGDKLETIERSLIDRTLILASETESLGEAVAALHKVSDLKDKQYVRGGGGGGNHGQVIELSLGKLANTRLEIAMGDNRVIMNLGGKDMTRAPAARVKDMVKELEDEKDRQRNPAEDEDLVWDFPAVSA